MKLPSHLEQYTEWTFVGPMGPLLPTFLSHHKILGVDGGSRFTGHMDAWVGDGDSDPNLVKAQSLFLYPSKKSDSDLALALALFTQSFPYTFHFWGLLGGRKDHELFNLGESAKFLFNKADAQINFYDHDGKIYFKLLGPGDWNLEHFGEFSLGTFEKQKIKLIGECEYQLKEATEISPLSSLGLSNEGNGKFILQSSLPVFVYFPEGK